eukprot:SAG31_NODE_44101_length_264_cov_0.630303_1_plen_39_part_10
MYRTRVRVPKVPGQVSLGHLWTQSMQMPFGVVVSRGGSM